MMNAIKYTMTITVQVLSTDSIPGLIHRIAHEIAREAIEGKLTMEDGDQIEWKTDSEEVTIV